MRKWPAPAARGSRTTSTTDLLRFVEAQRGIYDRALAELRAGRKVSHWMWFVFPQIAGLGRSLTSQFYAIADGDEAREYLEHEILGPRLCESTQAMLAWAGARSAERILGPIDTLKFQSSMTLFEVQAGETAPFSTALDVFYEGKRDATTLARL